MWEFSSHHKHDREVMPSVFQTLFHALMEDKNELELSFCLYLTEGRGRAE